MLGADQPLLVEPGVDRAHGVGVDAGHLGEVAHAGQARAGAQVAGGDQRLELPGELGREREVVVAVDREGRGQLRIHTARISARTVLVKRHSCLTACISNAWMGTNCSSVLTHSCEVASGS